MPPRHAAHGVKRRGTGSAFSTFRSQPKGALVALISVVVGIVVLLYPVVATNFNNFRQHQFANTYNSLVEQIPTDVKDAELAAARYYNEHLTGVPILDPWLTQVSSDPTSDAYKEYLSQLDALPAMARVRVPSVGINLTVQHGTSDQVIHHGAGHLYGTSLPIGGIGTHAVITSHSGMTDATLFDNLPQVMMDHLMFIDVYGETLAYQVDDISVVEPTDISQLIVEPGKDYLTLFTCTPYGINSHRLLVRGHRVPLSEDVAKISEQDSSTLVIQWWMWLLIGGAGLGTVALVVFLRRNTQVENATETS